MFSLKVCTQFRMALDMPFSVVLFLGVVVLDILFGSGSPIGSGMTMGFGFGFPIVVGNDNGVRVWIPDRGRE